METRSFRPSSSAGMQIHIQYVNHDSLKDWVIVEMQGDLESRVGDVQMNSKFIGDLHFSKTGVPILIIGHHILYGKVVKLEKPFVAIERHYEQKDVDTMEVDMGGDSQDELSRSYMVKAIIRKKLLFKTRPKPIIANVPKKI